MKRKNLWAMIDVHDSLVPQLKWEERVSNVYTTSTAKRVGLTASLTSRSRRLLLNLPPKQQAESIWTMPNFRVRSTVGGGASSMSSAIRSVASGSVRSSKYLVRRQSSKPELVNHGSRRVVRQAMVCAGSLRVRTCKLLWKPAVLQLVVTTTTSLGEDESHFDDVDDEEDSDDEDGDEVDNVTTMARPNKVHHYSLVFCHRSIMGHARRERIELDDPREPVEFIWGEDGLLSARFEFSIVYGSVGPSGRRRTLTCRATDAKEYLQWTEALRMAMDRHGKGDKSFKHNRSTHARTIASSKAPSNSRGSIGSFFDLDVVEEQQQQLEREAQLHEAVSTPTSPTAATAAEAVAPPEAAVAEESALKPVPVDIAAVYKVPKAGHRPNASVLVKSMVRPAGTKLQRRKRTLSSAVHVRRGSMHSMTLKSVTASAASEAQSSSIKVKEAKPFNPVISVSRPLPAGCRRRRSSSAARRLGSAPPKTRVRKVSLSAGNYMTPPRKDSWRPHTPDTNSGSKRNRLRVSVDFEPDEKRPRVPSSPLAILGALPILQAPSSLVDSPLDFIDGCDRPSADQRATEYVNSLVKIAGVSSAEQRQQLLQRHRQPRRTRVIPNDYDLNVILRESQSPTNRWLMSRRSSRLNLDMCDFEDVKSARSNRQRQETESWTAYLKAMECEL